MKIGHCYALKSYIKLSQLHCFLSLGMQITTQEMSVAKIQHSSRPFNVSLHTPISVTTKYCIYSVHTWTLEFNTISNVQVFRQFNKEPSQIAKFIGSTWGPPGSCWPQMGRMLVPWTLPVPSEFPPHKGQWRGALMFSLICVWINGWVNNREAGDLRRSCAHYDVIVMRHLIWYWDSPLLQYIDAILPV